jgi:hypothetical protein
LPAPQVPSPQSHSQPHSQTSSSSPATSS